MRLFYPPIIRRSNYPTRRRDHQYSYFGRYIREDCDYACFYCDRHEDEIGGEEEYELDHFRPSGRAEFSHLERDPHNLVWSCHRCNLLKRDHWLQRSDDADGHFVGGYLDRFACDAFQYIEVCDDGTLKAHTRATWMCKRLHLFRHALVLVRQRRFRIRKEVVGILRGIMECNDRLIHCSDPELRIELLKDRKSLIDTLEEIRALYGYLFPRMRTELQNLDL